MTAAVLGACVIGDDSISLDETFNSLRSASGTDALVSILMETVYRFNEPNIVYIYIYIYIYIYMRLLIRASALVRRWNNPAESFRTPLRVCTWYGCTDDLGNFEIILHSWTSDKWLVVSPQRKHRA